MVNGYFRYPINTDADLTFGMAQTYDEKIIFLGFLDILEVISFRRSIDATV